MHPLREQRQGTQEIKEITVPGSVELKPSQKPMRKEEDAHVALVNESGVGSGRTL